jgi:hypothetical protein
MPKGYNIEILALQHTRIEHKEISFFYKLYPRNILRRTFCPLSVFLFW